MTHSVRVSTRKRFVVTGHALLRAHVDLMKPFGIRNSLINTLDTCITNSPLVHGEYNYNNYVWGHVYF